MLTHKPLSVALLVAAVACTSAKDTAHTVAASADPAVSGGQAAVADNESQPDVVKVAAGSKDHTTLVAALKAADLVNVLANPGPFTVFAPNNSGFDKLPAGTVDNLLKPENKAKLAGILQHHVTTSALDVEYFQDGMSVAMADGGKEIVKKKDGAMWIGGAKVIASVRASNGWVHIVDAVLVPASR